jgi:outer membrane lipoprotein-sorting protein
MQNGIAVPFRQAEYVRNGLRYTLEISTVEMNVGIPESEFNIPAEIR